MNGAQETNNKGGLSAEKTKASSLEEEVGENIVIRGQEADSMEMNNLESDQSWKYK